MSSVALAAILVLAYPSLGVPPSSSVALETVALETVTPGTVVTEAEFLSVLNPDHPAFAASGEALAIARAQERGARTLENPEIEFLREAPSAGETQLELTVTWQPPRPARRRLAIASAGKELDAARAETRLEQMEVRLTLRQVFAQWAVAVARAERSSAYARHITGLAERERSRAQQGESSGLEARRLDLAVSEAESRLALDEAAALSAHEMTRTWRPDLPSRVSPRLPTLGPAAKPDSEHPQVSALAAELEAARLAREVAGKVTDWPKLVAGWQRLENTDGPIIGLTWSPPIADRRRAERDAAEARIRASETRLEWQRRQIEATRSGALAAYERLALAAAAATEATTDNPRLVEAAATAFRYGELDLTDLLEILRSTLTAELTALDLHAAALAAHRDLEAGAGQALTSPKPQTKE